MTVKFTYTMDDDVFIILGNIKSVNFEPGICYATYLIEFSDDLHYRLDSDSWIIKEVW